MAVFLCSSEVKVIMATDSELSRKEFHVNCVFILQLINISPHSHSVRGKYNMREIFSLGFFQAVLSTCGIIKYTKLVVE